MTTRLHPTSAPVRPAPGLRELPREQGTRPAPTVRADPFRAQVRHLLRCTGVPWPALAVAAGIPVIELSALLHHPGRDTLSVDHAQRLLAIDSIPLREQAQSRRTVGDLSTRVRRLVAVGHPLRHVRNASGLRGDVVTHLARGQLLWCSRSTGWAIQAAEELLLATDPRAAGALKPRLSA